ncbi:DUF5320 domain-containing protein [Patescibacteria group bacterium]|nr:DUF5320 domain-containing protein [Patescibacteria group bacterium]MBU1673538.1 DUF5320 domain-containing protein [Patescibacteria group bacterium]MBU1963616.1 DUF5320 domain-containing protein [Patescibacteria group bacterium]
MPRQDGTGPQGQGPMTGRGLGNCRGSRSVVDLEKEVEGLKKEVEELKNKKK